MRSKLNARRHGLATSVEDDPEAAAGIESLAAILADGCSDVERAEQSRAVAGCYFDLRRIRAARHDVFLRLGVLENASDNDFKIAMRAMDRISRYENRRARSANGRWANRVIELSVFFDQREDSA